MEVGPTINLVYAYEFWASREKNAFCPSTDKSWTRLRWIWASEREEFLAKQSQEFVGKQREEFLEALRIEVGQTKRRVPGGAKDWIWASKEKSSWRH
ncbi:unnamed protein product [Prunus armeniaca]|uniref:Uncharacterized protein n=1 Tax=Prunus armeniaca TaxID=36596 RepID=A0A6J5WBN5_PRUAR|nr:unnamed protein product [Prunus armeniaca]